MEQYRFFLKNDSKWNRYAWEWNAHLHNPIKTKRPVDPVCQRGAAN